MAEEDHESPWRMVCSESAKELRSPGGRELRSRGGQEAILGRGERRSDDVELGPDVANSEEPVRLRQVIQREAGGSSPHRGRVLRLRG